MRKPRPKTERTPSTLERGKRWSWRNKAIMLSAASILLTLTVVLSVLASRAAEERSQSESSARDKASRAKQILAKHEKRRTRLTQTQWTMQKLRSTSTQRALTTIEQKRLERLDRFATKEAAARVRMFAEVEALLTEARRLAPHAPGLVEAWAACYYQHWRDAQAARDRSSKEHYARLVRETDRGGALVKNVEGLRQVKIESDPPGAEIYLFRYDEEAIFDADGERRLVPYVPEADLPLKAGAWALRVARRTDGFEAEDLITRVAGHPIEGCVLASRVPELGLQGLTRCDRLIAIDGREVRDLLGARQLEEEEGTHRYTFRKASGREVRIVGRSLDALGVAIASPLGVARSGGVQARVLRNGSLATMTLPAGLELRTTACPLILTPAAKIGTTPLLDNKLKPAWYIAVLKAPGHETLRMPFHVDHPLDPYGHDPALHANMLPDDTTPPGFVYVGCDFYKWGERPYWILERQISSGEYLEFLNHEETRRTREASAQKSKALLPHGPLGPWRLDRDGRAQMPPGLAPDIPVLGVSLRAAQAHVAWRNSHDDDRPLDADFDLPSSFEWTRTSKGGDKRKYVFGEEFRASWIKSRDARALGAPEPGLRYAIDESPFGVFDLAGSAAEWCIRRELSGTEITRKFVVCSGSFEQREAAEFRIDRWRPFSPDAKKPDFGFRIVLREREESR